MKKIMRIINNHTFLKIIFILILTSIKTISVSGAEEDCVYNDETACYSSFEEYITANPVGAATTNPSEYITYIATNPQHITEHPEAYEAAVSQDVMYINQNKAGFMLYLKTKNAPLYSIGSDLKSYDVATGRMETKGPSGETVVSISTEEIKEFIDRGVEGILILEDGSLAIVTPREIYKNGGEKVTERDIFLVRGSIQKGKENNIEVTGGAIFDGTESITIREDNSAAILPILKQGMKIILKVGSTTPILTLEGNIIKGQAVFERKDADVADVLLGLDSSFVTNKGTVITTGEKDYISVTTNKALCQGRCIVETQDELIIDSSPVTENGENGIIIDTQDGAYKAVIVKKIEYSEGTIEVNINKDGEITTLIFSKNPPAVKGNINGLQTNIAHIFEKDDKTYPWIIYDGKETEAQGTVTEQIIQSLYNKDDANEKLDFLMESLGSQELNPYIMSNLFSQLDKNPDLQKELYDKYKRAKGEEKKLSHDDITLLEDVNNEDLWKHAIEESEEIEDIGIILKKTKQNPELQEAALNKEQELTNRDIIVEAISNAATYDIKKMIMQKVNFEEGDFAEKEYGKGIAFRTVLTEISNDKELLKETLKRMPERLDMDFYPAEIESIYFDAEFQKQTKSLDFANRFSVATTAERYLRRAGIEPTAENIAEATTSIMQQRAAFAEYHILDEETYYIPITHEESRFQNDDMIKIARDAGVQNVADPALKGSTDSTKTEETKDKFLTYVEQSNEKGKTTIHFSNHGGPEHQWLSSGQAGSEISDELHRSDAISYVELGDALLSRGNLEDVTVMIDSCYSNDFKNNLYNYLEEKGSQKMPIVITETNRGQVGYVNVFVSALDKVHEAGKPLTGADIYKVESETFITQDLSVTIPVEASTPKEYSDPTTPSVIDFGSTYDDGAAEKPSKPEEDLYKQETAPLPTTVIEIAANEAEMMEIIYT